MVMACLSTIGGEKAKFAMCGSSAMDQIPMITNVPGIFFACRIRSMLRAVMVFIGITNQKVCGNNQNRLPGSLGYYAATAY